MTRPSPPQLLRETATLAHRFHWQLDTILDLEHRDRRSFLAETRLNDKSQYTDSSRITVVNSVDFMAPIRQEKY